MMLDLPDQIAAAIGAISGVEKPPQGATSTVHVVDGERGRFVVKRCAGALFAGWLEQEYRVLQALQTTALPVPRVAAFHANPDGAKREAWLVTEWFPGESVRAVLRRERDRHRRETVVSAWARALAQVHATPPPPALDASRRWLDDMLVQAAYNLEHFTVDGDAALLQRIQTQRPPAQPQTLIHGDFTVDNALIVAESVTAIIDWSGGAVGDPRYDLALATERRRGVFDTRDEAVFWESYGRSPMDAEELAYWLALCEFF